MTWTPQLLQSMIYRSFCICQMQGKEPVKLMFGPDTEPAFRLLCDSEPYGGLPTEMFGMPVAPMAAPGIAVVGNSP